MANKYSVKQVGDPNKMGDKREIVVYKIYKGSTAIGEAIYRPSLYKSKYSIYWSPKSYPKSVRDRIVARDGQSGLAYRHNGGDSAKNPTAVLKQFKLRYEGAIDNYTQTIKRVKKAQGKLSRGLKKTGLSPSDYEALGKYQAYIKNNKEDIKESLRKIKAFPIQERKYIAINRSNIKRWELAISKLKKK
jgi:hypothetical protein